jgi:hypothetical protein
VPEKFFHVQANVSGNLSKKNGGDVSAFVEWNRGSPAVGMAKLLMRTALTDFYEAQMGQNCDDFRGLQNRRLAHAQAT